MEDPPRPRKLPSKGPGADIVAATLDAAAALIVRDGYAAVTTNKIAKRAGISIGSLYQYFPDKHTIVAEIARRRERTGLELATERASRSAPLDARTATAIWVGVATDPALGDAALRRALLLEVPPFWVLESARETDAGVERMVASVIEGLRPQMRGGDARLMAFIGAHAVEGVAEAVLCERADRFADLDFREELFRLAWRYVAEDGQDLEPPPMDARPPIRLPPRVVREPAPRKLVKSARGRATMQRILDAAKHALVSDGHTGLKVRSIAKHAGLSPAALYRYFPNIRALLTELTRRREERALSLVTDALAPAAGESLRETIQRVTDSLCGPMHGPVPLRSATAAHVPRSWFLDATNAMESGLESIVAQAMSAHAGSIRNGNRDWMGFFVTHAVQRTIEAAALQRPDLFPEPLSTELAELLYRYLRA